MSVAVTQGIKAALRSRFWSWTSAAKSVSRNVHQRSDPCCPPHNAAKA